jgi:hypothetical protein
MQVAKFNLCNIWPGIGVAFPNDEQGNLDEFIVYETLARRITASRSKTGGILGQIASD